MIDALIKILTDPNNPNFWSAVSVFITLLGFIFGFIGWLLNKAFNNNVSKITKILIQSSVELYLDWVKVESKSLEVNNESIRIWISENGGSILTGRSYLVFKRFIKELKDQGYKDINLPDENTYEVWVSKYDSSSKWSRVEW